MRPRLRPCTRGLALFLGDQALEPKLTLTTLCALPLGRVEKEKKGGGGEGEEEEEEEGIQRRGQGGGEEGDEEGEEKGQKGETERGGEGSKGAGGRGAGERYPRAGSLRVPLLLPPYQMARLAV